MILNRVKKFPITCYGAISLLIYFVLYAFSITYDYGLVALLPMLIGAPFMWAVTSVEKLLLPEFLLRSASGKSSLEDLIIEFCLVIFVTILLDLLLLSIRTGSLKNLLKKTYHKLTKPKK